jgi:hypothetical protein
MNNIFKFGVIPSSQPSGGGVSVEPGLYTLGSIPAANNSSYLYFNYQTQAEEYLANGIQYRIVFKYTSGSSHTGDVQLDDINFLGNTYDPQTGTHSFQTSTANIVSYTSVSWTNLASSSKSNGRWNRDSGGTISGGTGNTSGYTGQFYYYAETTSSFNMNFWLRSPIVTYDGNNNNINFRYARHGATCGPMTVYLEIL